MRSPCFKCEKLYESKKACSAETCEPLRAYQKHLDQTRVSIRAIDPATDSYALLMATNRSKQLPGDS